MITLAKYVASILAVLLLPIAILPARAAVSSTQCRLYHRR